ncbi:MAG: beta-ketoacyl synthase N-terminal-like domain-containing protein [Myxococcota bacterium]|nr:beta-ketoacyl synthase N-terminal-like domain-containing protein [Myxococcota bacterium]
MNDALRVRVAEVGVVCALGSDLQEVQRRLRAGESAIVPCDISGSPVARIAARCEVDDRPLLTRRRDRKLFSRAATLLLCAASKALAGWEGDREELGLFVGVRREPPDTGEAEEAILASASNGVLSTALLAEEGRHRYPPLQPLKTLPNMALAHVAIQLGIRGESGVVAGGSAAGVMAVCEGIAAVAEGRSPAALVGAADSWLDRGGLRDWARLGLAERPPGEAAVVFRIEPDDGRPGLGVLERGGAGAGRDERVRSHWAQLGDCGVADGLIAALSSGGELLGVDPGKGWAEATWTP